MNIIKKNNRIVVGVNDDIIVYDIETYRTEHVKVVKPLLPEDANKKPMQSLKDLKNITSIEFSNFEDYIVVATENKQVIVYDTDLQLKKHFVANRVPSKVCFTPSHDILVADRSGDVFLYKLTSEEPPRLLLGHLSVILDLVISDCGKYIITCDRDEKIRVSCFPNCYHIISFCLGHKEFVTKINLVDNILVSASGDGTVRFWNYVEGEELSLINTSEYIQEIEYLKTFADEMDKEKVDVIALPVTNMQSYKSNKLFTAVSIHNYDFIQLYSTDLSSFKSDIIGKISVKNPFTFCLHNDLYIISDTFLLFKRMDDSFMQIDDENAKNFYDKYENIFKIDKNNLDISALYKRKFDNVKEYLERKRKRLETK